MSRYFPNLFGNERTKERLGAAIDSNTLPHAFLISGPDGSGKRTLANEICAALNCEKKGDPSATLPCNRCNTCRRIAEGKFTDIKVLARAKEKMTVGVEEVRLFRADMFLSSTESPYKLYVIEDAERKRGRINAIITIAVIMMINIALSSTKPLTVRHLSLVSASLKLRILSRTESTLPRTPCPMPERHFFILLIKIPFCSANKRRSISVFFSLAMQI